MTPLLLTLTEAYAQNPLTTPAKPTIELLESSPENPAEKIIPPTEPDPIIVVKPDPTSPITGCPFPSVAERNITVEANIFGPVPTVNGVLPANMPLGVPFDGPVPGTEYIRISSADGNGGHYYSTVQAWNADMTMIMVGDGVPDKNRVLDASNNYSLLPQRINLSSERVWSNVEPNIIYGISGGTTVYRLDIITGNRTAIYSRPNNATISFMGKPNITDNDSKMVFLVRNENRIVTIDLQSSAIPRPVIGEIDWSPYGNLNTGGIFLNFEHAGNWVIVRPNNNGGGVGSVLHRLSPDLTTVESIGPMCCHSDSAFNTQGESIEAETIWNSRLRIYNYDNKSSYNTPIMINRTPGQSDYMFASYVSGRGQKTCGNSWVVLSGEEGNGSPNHPILLYKVDGDTNTPTFKIMGGDLHSGAPETNQYSNLGKQKAVQSPDGNSVLFDSDGGIPGGELSTYILRDKQS